MQPTTLFLPDETQQTLQTLAEQHGKTVDEIVQEAIRVYWLTTQKQRSQSIGLDNRDREDLSDPVDEQTAVGSGFLQERSIDRRSFMKRPLAERRQILAEQAEAMVQHYEQDTTWQEWVNFDLGEIHDYESQTG